MKSLEKNILVQALMLWVFLSVPLSVTAHPSVFPERPAAVDIRLDLNGYTFNNADYLTYDHASYEADRVYDMFNTDDQLNFCMTTVGFHFHKKFERTEVDLEIDHSGFWGNDVLMGGDNGANAFRFLSLHAIGRPVDFYQLKAGRFDYEIGDACNDFFFSDTIDAVENTFLISLGPAPLRISFLTEVMSNGAKPTDTYAWSGLEKDDEEVNDFDGDTLSLRFGSVIRYFAASLFSYYVRYGANTVGGADISDNGKTDVNEADHDYLSLSGFRAFANFSGWVKTDFTLAWSTGKDFQYEGEKVYNGYAAAANVYLDLSGRGAALPLLERVYLSSGYFSPSYCGMKAASPGGMLMYLYKGYSVSPCANFYHFRDSTKKENAVSGFDATVSKLFLKSGISMKAGPFSVELMNVIWFANEDPDTRLANIAGKENAGERAPAYMGNESEARLSYTVDQIELFFTGALYVPGDYYKTRAEYNTCFSGGSDIFYGFNLGCTYRFGI